MSAEVFSFDMAGAGDVSMLDQWLSSLDLTGLRRLIVFAKTEGHHAPNDFSRDLLKLKLDSLFATHMIADRAVSMLAIGSEGVGSPKGFAFAEMTTAGALLPASASSPAQAPQPTGDDQSANNASAVRLALGFARSEIVPIAELGSLALVDRVAQAATDAMRDAKLEPAQVRLLFIKTPMLSPRHPDATPANSLMHRGRAIAALGGGVALGQIDRTRITESAIAQDLSLYAQHVQGVTGAEIRQVEAVAFGNRPGAGGDLQIAATHTRDILDQGSIRQLLSTVGMRFDEAGELLDGDRIAAMICKTMVAESGLVRGSRTTVYSSSWAPESHIRAAASGVLGSLLGHLRFFVSADSVHMAPEGGGMTALFYHC